MSKDNMMKYLDEPLDTKSIPIETFTKLHDEFFSDDILKLDHELKTFKNKMFKEYLRFYMNKDNANAELEFHKQVKKHRKTFNHNIQEISKKKKFSLIKSLLGKITEYQIN